MNFKKLFFAYQESIPPINEVGEAEKTINLLHNRLKTIDKELAEEYDTAIGHIAWAYEKQGFGGGLIVAREIL